MLNKIRKDICGRSRQNAMHFRGTLNIRRQVFFSILMQLSSETMSSGEQLDKIVSNTFHFNLFTQKSIPIHTLESIPMEPVTTFPLVVKSLNDVLEKKNVFHLELRLKTCQNLSWIQFQTLKASRGNEILIHFSKWDLKVLSFVS